MDDFDRRATDIILKTYCQRVEDSENLFTLSLKGILELIILKNKVEWREAPLENLIDKLEEELSIAIPRTVLDSFEKQTISLTIEEIIKKYYLINDKMDFGSPIQSYLPKNIMASLSDIDLMSENPLEK